MTEGKLKKEFKEFPVLEQVLKEVGELGPIRVRRCTRHEANMIKARIREHGNSRYSNSKGSSLDYRSKIYEYAPDTCDGCGILIWWSQMIPVNDLVPPLAQTIVFKFH